MTLNLELQSVPPAVVTAACARGPGWDRAGLGRGAAREVVAAAPMSRLAPVTFVPVIVTVVPTGPEVGVNPLIVGLVGGAAEDGGAMAIAATTINGENCGSSKGCRNHGWPPHRNPLPFSTRFIHPRYQRLPTPNRVSPHAARKRAIVRLRNRLDPA